MAWIESHQQLERHPKTYDLMNFMGWDLDTTLGKLHRFWWWCVDYAEDGDLRKHSSARIGSAVGLSGEVSIAFVNAMIKAGWIDEEPYLRVHDWWDYIGLFLQRKYGDKNKAKWEPIKQLYSNCTVIVQKGVQELTQPNLTKPNLKDEKNIVGSEKPKPSFPKESDVYKLSLLLFTEIVKHNPNARLNSLSEAEKERTVQKWAKDIDLLTRKDGKEPSIVEEVIRWCQQDGFWRSNILSGAKLREKWDTLTAQMGRQKGGKLDRAHAPPGAVRAEPGKYDHIGQ